MQVGTLVRHIEHGYIGILVRHGRTYSDRWLIHWSGTTSPWFATTQYFSECELEVVCE